MFDGRVFKFKCDDDAVMFGDQQVFCDGKSWNSTMPNCYGDQSRNKDKYIIKSFQ